MALVSPITLILLSCSFCRPKKWSTWRFNKAILPNPESRRWMKKWLGSWLVVVILVWCLANFVKAVWKWITSWGWVVIRITNPIVLLEDGWQHQCVFCLEFVYMLIWVTFQFFVFFVGNARTISSRCCKILQVKLSTQLIENNEQFLLQNSNVLVIHSY